jgi:hypothetical protein
MVVIHSPPMISGTAWLWILTTAAAVTIAGYLLNVCHRWLKRRARRAHYVRAGHETRPQPMQSRPTPLDGITPDRAGAIRSHAEKAARSDWVTGNSAMPNPYAKGTSEFVLWYATYQLGMATLAEQAEGDRKDQGS